jgi:hypothetical protein
MDAPKSSAIALLAAAVKQHARSAAIEAVQRSPQYAAPILEHSQGLLAACRRSEDFAELADQEPRHGNGCVCRLCEVNAAGI